MTARTDRTTAARSEARAARDGIGDPADIQRLQAEIARLRIFNEHLRHQLEQTQLKCDRLRQDAAHLVAAAKEGDELAAAEATKQAKQIKSQLHKNAKLKSQLEAEQAALKQARKEIRNRDMSIERMRNSPSWKLGAPVRKLNALFRSARGVKQQSDPTRP